MDPTFIAIIVGVVVILIAIYFMANRLSSSTISKMSARSAELAEMLGLPAPKVQDPHQSAFYVSELKGEVNNREFSFIQYTRSEKRADAFVTEFAWACKRTFMPRIIISKEGLFTPLSKQLGVIDIQLGDPEFDIIFLIRCDDAEFAKKVLNQEVRKEILRCNKQWQGTLIIQHSEVHYEESGVLIDEKDLQRLHRLIELGQYIAESIETLPD